VLYIKSEEEDPMLAKTSRVISDTNENAYLSKIQNDQISRQGEEILIEADDDDPRWFNNNPSPRSLDASRVQLFNEELDAKNEKLGQITAELEAQKQENDVRIKELKQ